MCTQENLGLKTANAAHSLCPALLDGRGGIENGSPTQAHQGRHIRDGSGHPVAGVDEQEPTQFLSSQWWTGGELDQRYTMAQLNLPANRLRARSDGKVDVVRLPSPHSSAGACVRVGPLMLRKH